MLDSHSFSLALVNKHINQILRCAPNTVRAEYLLARWELAYALSVGCREFPYKFIPAIDTRGKGGNQFYFGRILTFSAHLPHWQSRDET